MKLRGSRLAVIYLTGAAISIACSKNDIPSKGNGRSDSTKPVDNFITVNEWLTSSDKSFLFTEKKNATQFDNRQNNYPTIETDTSTKFQTIDGFGFCLTDASTYLINQLSADAKDALLKELFTTDENHIGISYIRLSIGASDLSRKVYSYDDVAGDTALTNFSFNDEEVQTTVAVVKQILALNPNLKILGSPWSAPAWMKDNNDTKGGSLKPEYYAAYAKYFVKYIQAMKRSGIHIDAITPQNEPLNPKNNPSMYMTADEERDFIKNDLGPAFRRANIDTKIWVYDHNCDHPEYATTILADADATQYVDGSAFHLYAGDIAALGGVHTSYPGKNLYFTEQYTPTTGNFWGDLNWAVQNLIIGASENWSRNVLEWNLASDPQASLHTPGGCNTCLGAVTVNNNTVTRNQSYYIIAHASKFVRPGSYRIGSSRISGLTNVAFETPDNKKVLIVLNNSGQQQNFNIKYNGKTAQCSLDNASVATYVWQ